MDRKILALAISLSVTVTAQAETPSLEQMWQIIQQQQAEITQLFAADRRSCFKMR